MGDVLAIAESRDGQVRGVSREVVTAARTVADGLGGQVVTLVLGGDPNAEGLGAAGSDSVIHVPGFDTGAAGPEGTARAVASIAEGGDYGAVVLAATAQGKDLAPRVAAALDRPLASDVTAVGVDGGTVTARRPVYAGKAFANVAFEGTGAVISVRPNTFAPGEGGAPASVETREIAAEPAPVRVVSTEAAGAGSVDVAEATTVVSGGRGMKDPDNWNLLEDLRDAFGDGTGLGASRAVVDAGWRPHSEQVGQTGKTVSPNLYVAVGISGAIQHLAGMRTAGTIVAINKDADAPIFQVADYGIVGDLFEVVPRLTEAVRALKAE